MLRRISHRLNSEERGFTLIELLVVILIIGILAAIALPAFLGQRSKGQDSSAKSDARNMVSQVESCYTDTQNYQSCDSDTELSASGGKTGLNIGTGQGQVTLSAGSTDTYTVTAFSKSGNTFFITNDTNGVKTRTCTTTSKGSCPANGSW